MIVLVCAVLTFLSLWTLSFAQNSFHLAVAGALLGAGYGSILPTLQSWALFITPPERRGITNGMTFSCIDLGIGLSGIVFGALAAFLDIVTIFQIASVFLVLTFLLVLKKTQKDMRLTEGSSVDM